MTSKYLLPIYKQFIKEHNADEFMSSRQAFRCMMDIATYGIPWGKRKLRRETISAYNSCITSWWYENKTPLSEDKILSSLDSGMVTHGWMGWNSRYDGGGMTKSDAILKLADFSFKYNIIGYIQEPGHLRLILKESEDHQTNISGEVIEYLDKCLDF